MRMINDYEIRGDHVAVFVRRQNGDQFEFLIDTEDLPLIRTLSNTYSIANCSGKYYAKGYRRVGVRRYQKPYVHRMILDAPSGMVVDHINGDGLDNRRSNLRIVTQSENLQNRRGPMTNSRSGIRGVFRRSDCDRWEAQVVLGRRKYRSLHPTIEEAEAAVREMRRKLLPYSSEG